MAWLFRATLNATFATGNGIGVNRKLGQYQILVWRKIFSKSKMGNIQGFTHLS
jgi:hypothetical protein